MVILELLVKWIFWGIIMLAPAIVITVWIKTFIIFEKASKLF